MDLQNRIAICFSGQIRTGIENSPKILEYLGDMRNCSDVFIHSWNTETESPWTEKNKDNLEIHKVHHLVSNEVFDCISNIYNPLDMRVDMFDIYQRCHYKRVISRGANAVHQIPMFQSIWESNQLKLAHEKLCNSKYGLVLRIRFDINFGDNRTLLEDMQYIAHKKNLFYFLDFNNKFPDEIEDVCWISSSEIMDRVCNFVIERETNAVMNKIDWQMHMKQYLDMQGIVTRPFKNNNIVIVRNESINPNKEK
jgi:hypothetical protein